MNSMDDFKKNKEKIKKKNDLPVLDSDQDFLNAFLDDSSTSNQEKKKDNDESTKKDSRVNKHGLPFIDDYESQFNQDPETGEQHSNSQGNTGPEEELEEDFALLLDQSLKEKKPRRPDPKPMPLKRHLKRYPPPEADLDLHGFTAIGAQMKAKSFITSARLEGFFTLRIIVGRGIHSQDGPVLPDVVEDLLKALKKENFVLTYEWEKKKKNKSGAVIVYLKQFND